MLVAWMHASEQVYTACMLSDRPQIHASRQAYISLHQIHEGKLWNRPTLHACSKSRPRQGEKKKKNFLEGLFWEQVSLVQVTAIHSHAWNVDQLWIALGVDCSVVFMLFQLCDLLFFHYFRGGFLRERGGLGWIWIGHLLVKASLLRNSLSKYIIRERKKSCMHLIFTLKQDLSQAG